MICKIRKPFKLSGVVVDLRVGLGLLWLSAFLLTISPLNTAQAAGTCSEVFAQRNVQQSEMDLFERIRSSADIEELSPLIRVEAKLFREMLDSNTVQLNLTTSSYTSSQEAVANVRALVTPPLTYQNFMDASTRAVNLWDSTVSYNYLRPMVQEWNRSGRELNVPGILIPSIRSLDHRDMMELWGDGLFPMGIVKTPIQHIDGLPRMTPAFFATHDVAHADLWRTAIAERAVRLNISNEQVFMRFRSTNKFVLDKLARISDRQDRLRATFIWFALAHEKYVVTLNKQDYLEAEKVHSLNSLISLAIGEPQFLREVGQETADWARSRDLLREIIQEL